MSTEKRNGLLIGLTGSIGAGKSTVAEIIRKKYPVLDTDRIAREIMEQDEAIRDALVERFGVQIYLSDGSLDRHVLSSIAFGDEDNLRALNQIVHPPTIQRVLDNAAKLSEEGHRLIFVESALIFEAEIEEMFDYTIAVSAEIERILQRMTERDGIERERVLARLRYQLPPEEKANLADFVIRNNGDMSDLRAATTAIISILSHLGKRRSS
ncbi:MAG: dephospho-CoA kinase [Bacteroidetes bacterium]|nr:dephospho-CoA kinase [Bacteroidota bacterium]